MLPESNALCSWRGFGVLGLLSEGGITFDYPSRTMRWTSYTAAMIVGFLMVGCSSTGTSKPTASNATAMLVEPAAARVAPDAPALAFPSQDGPPSGVLDRDQRSPSAYFGYESATTTFAYTRYDDRTYFCQGNGSFERRAMGTRIGVTTR